MIRRLDYAGSQFAQSRMVARLNGILAAEVFGLNDEDARGLSLELARAARDWACILEDGALSDGITPMVVAGQEDGSAIYHFLGNGKVDEARATVEFEPVSNGTNPGKKPNGVRKKK